ncbi:MAG: endonuclease/exonuclease/phosphatase family protein, partial [Pseudomonadota bacterium]
AIAVPARLGSRAPENAGERFNTRFSKPIDSDSERLLRVATFNIQTGKSHAGIRNIEASALALKDVHFAGVQEVYAPEFLNWFGIGLSQPEVLAKTGSFGYSFHPTRKRWFRNHRGNTMLSKLLIKAWKTINLPDWSNKSHRNYTVAKVLWEGKEITIINTHLHTSIGNEAQLDIVLKEFVKHTPAILMGDFNTQNNHPLIQAGLKAGQFSDAIGQLALDPEEEQRIDWILTRGLTAVSGNYLPKGISDHPYYEVQLRLGDD